MKIRTLIVDDEPLARERVRTLLLEEQDIEVVGEAGNGPDAVAAINRCRPELVFLDVQMPGQSGFEVLKEIPRECMPLVIFVTAYDRHALEAFEVHALDYLLKPFKQARFKQTVERARQQVAERQAGQAAKGLLDLLGQPRGQTERLTRIAVKNGDRMIFVRTSQIQYLEAAGNYVVLHTAKENHVVRETLSALEEQLNPKQFLRISRSTLVNVEAIKELQPLFKGEHVIVLQDGKQLGMTRGVREVQEALKFS